MKTSVSSLFLLVLIPLLPGCYNYVPAAISSANLTPKGKVIGVASGKGESLEDAVRDAIGDTGADTMVDVFAEKQLFCFFLCYPTGMTRVFGTLIKYEDSSLNPALFAPQNIQTTNTQKNASPKNEETNWPDYLRVLDVGASISITLKNGTVIKGKFYSYADGVIRLKELGKYFQTTANIKEVSRIVEEPAQ